MSRARNITLVFAFVAVLVAPTVARVFRWNPMKSINEKRALAVKPTDSIWSQGGFSRVPVIAHAWERYFEDHFGLRKLFLGTYRLATFYLLRSSPNPSVVVGRSDGHRRWLFFDASVSKDGVGLESIEGKIPYTPASLAQIATELRQATDLARAKGVKLVIAVCPDKQSIYPEYLPWSKRPAPGTSSRLDQFWAMAVNLRDLPLVDMRGPLFKAKPTEQLYYPSDTHWNWKAGLLAYLEIAKVLEAQDPSRGMLPVEKLTWMLGPPRVGDLTTLMGIPAIGGDKDWLPEFPQFARYAGPKRGKLLILGDSFFELVQPFFDMQFETVKKIYVTRGSRTLVANGVLDTEKPDVVIIQSVERYWTMD